MAKKKKQNELYYKISRRIYGLALVILSVAILTAINFFSSADSSFNLASDKISNPLGYWGSCLAEIIITFTGGIALPLFLIVVMLWGYRLCILKAVSHPWLRLSAAVTGIIVSAAGFNAVCSLGGQIGTWINNKIFAMIPDFAYRQPLAAALWLIAAFICFNLATDVSFRSWYNLLCNICKCIWRGLKLTCNMFIGFFRLLKNCKYPTEHTAKERKEPVLKESKKHENKPSADNRKTSGKPDDGYIYPDVALLSKPKERVGVTVSEKELEQIAANLESVLQEFGVNGKIVKIRPGPVVTLYELEPAPGTKIARVIGLADDIARSMSAVSVRIAVVTGSNTIGIELPNTTREIVWLRDLLGSKEFRETKNTLNIVLGKDIGGENVYADLAKMPHLLVAGTTGSGKSVGMNSMILSLLFKMRPDECKLIMIDPKMLEFSVYNGIPHLLTPVITDPAKAVLGLKWAVKEMEDRYSAMSLLNVRNISGYNKKLEEIKSSGKPFIRTVQTGFNAETGAPVFEKQELDLTPLPYIVIVVDEMADLMLVAGKDVEAAIQRLAQMARAAGIHLILSTQRPSVDVITGVIKANFPTRISFQVTSKIDSRTILGEQGAEQLLGMGDMLYMPAGQRPIRVHGSFVKDSEVEKIAEFLKSQKEPEYINAVTEGELNVKDGGSVFDKTAMGAGSGSDDDLYNQAVEIVRNDKKTSISYVQRRLRIGYNRAAVLIERMEDEGVLSAPDHTGKREIL